jgi:hypothetical protein
MLNGLYEGLKAYLVGGTLAVHLIRADVDEALDAVHLHTEKSEKTPYQTSH